MKLGSRKIPEDCVLSPDSLRGLPTSLLPPSAHNFPTSLPSTQSSRVTFQQPRHPARLHTPQVPSSDFCLRGIVLFRPKSLVRSD